ncbi:MAG: aldehyde ferredoxin oxidoreductase C-terminal domain-containing protein, partial [Candidatus Hadarchaeota archaeon]|nr:aldehyde ferredoxin oxidoreductase C-terminal domain-containing protein [Candidatus Hadarchaeota archaeon]
AWTIGEEVLRANYDRFSTEGKAELVFRLQNTRAAVDSLGVCVMAGRVIGMEEMARIMTLTTGWNFSSEEITKAGERIYNLERLLAVRDGIRRKDDTLPPRILNETLPQGPSKNIKLSKENLDRMLDEYYKLRGWDKGGKPTEGKLKELGIPGLLR